MTSIASDLIERLRKRLEAEASQKNSAYDRFGMDNTPQSVDPDVFAAAEALSQLTREVDAKADALKPFAAFADLVGAAYLPDDHVITMGSGMAAPQLTMGDCRRAREVLSRSSGRVSDATE